MTWRSATSSSMRPRPSCSSPDDDVEADRDAAVVAADRCLVEPAALRAFRVAPAVRVVPVARVPPRFFALAAAFDGAPPSWDVELHDDAPAGADVVVSAPGSPVAGSVAFDLADPRATVARVAAALGARSALVVVTSPVGGAGATSVPTPERSPGLLC